MSAGLYPAENSEESDEDVGDLDKISVNPPVKRDKKKDERKRKKEKARKKEVSYFLKYIYITFQEISRRTLHSKLVFSLHRF